MGIRAVNIVLVHIGEELPDHIYDCVTQIKSFTNAKIWLITDALSRMPAGCEVVTLRDLQHNSLIHKLKTYNFLDGFWSHTLSRLFYVNALLETKDLEECIHIENDVLLFAKPETLLEPLKRISDGAVALCPVGARHASAAFMYASSYVPIKRLCEEMIQHLKIGKNLASHMQSDGVDEMQLLCHIAKCHSGLINYLPILPSGMGSWNFGLSSNTLWDPASVGQYVGGIPSSPGVPWAGDHHYIGAEINAGNIRLEMVPYAPRSRKTRPALIVDGKKYFYACLHIHCKDLKRWM